MKLSQIIKIALFALIAVVIVYTYLSSNSNLEQGKYLEKMNIERAEKNEEFKNEQTSPLKKEEIDAFKSLNYYTPDKKFIVNASLEWADKPSTIKIASTNGDPRTYKKVAWATFKIGNQEQKLVLLQNALPNPLTKGLTMVLFRDQTSGKTTYGAGRYIELRGLKKGAMQTVIDFNKAYNPYCAYNDSYDCPLPPLENQMTIEINAGEKKYHL
ncbi:DUF1684 domain-containing protein [Flammeovirga aprica]|uniref:DUF1684 domain-containing protein n=1 Tax=Flammeovirga aprica JL-4 TaxID=694437 RepID=A0A7X9P371_9BACT|nr:DUF1684 domain-containing protein [Flammeovirga aprica]NME67572.1 DUF1684 domain-containing protein [Flammeovirga aprica JL-4]